MGAYTKELRQQIVRDFAVRHNGLYDPRLFLAEVKAVGEEHPAYAWFEWNGEKAAQEYRLWQARTFAKDLRISFTVEVVGRSAPIKIKEVEMPLVISPLAGRNSGGGYILTDPNNPEHMREHCRQAAEALEAWLRRYRAAVELHGLFQVLERQVATLREAGGDAEAA